ncbi:MAG: amino acid ABC transporter [Gammaproteobacteria bacterium]|nr:amino acid ABC transporter [Gammaproteobacteria bacterium]
MFHPISIRTNILTNFLIVIILIAASLLSLEYYFSKQMALSAAHKSFSQTVEKVAQHIKSRDTLTKNMLNLTELYPNLTLPPMDPENIETIKRFALNMQRSANIYAMYIGHDNGDFFEVINMKLSDQLHKHFKAPANTRWTIIKIAKSPEISSKRIRQFDYYDNDLTFISSRSDKSVYYANKRPWFIQATQSTQAIRTDPYLFTNLQQKGITFAKQINGTKAVLAIDFTLSKLNALLKNEKIDPSSELLMFGQNDEVIASSNANKIKGQKKNQALNAFFTQSLKNGQTDRILQYKNQSDNKLIMVTTLSKELHADTHIGISIDASVMLNPYFEKIIYSLIIAILFLILSIPLVLYMTSRIVKPIQALMIQNTKIKDRQFSEVIPVKSNIVELSDLSDSLVSMSQSIQAFQKAQQELMDSFIRLIAEAIDSKSAYTGGHCQRVPEFAMMLAKIVSDSDAGEFKTFSLDSDDAWREFEMGALLHDCGKVTTPEYVVDKSTKLETIYNRIHEIRTRFEVLWRDIDIEYYQRLAKNEDSKELNHWRQEAQQSLQDDFNFISEVNMGGEFMSEDKKSRVHSIAQRTWIRHFDDRIGLSDDELMRYQNLDEQILPVTEQLLMDKNEHLVERINFDEESYKQQGFKLDVPEHLYNYGELYNLCIEKGTLSNEERFKINEHVIMTIKMLELLPFPEHMKKIPEYAGTHHETLIATGYPRQLTKEQLSVPARIMAIADIFEALTASDRPYKKGKTLSEAIRIMSFMKKDQHIDGELFDIFLQSGVYKNYAEKYLKKEQIDDVDIQSYLGQKKTDS